VGFWDALWELILGTGQLPSGFKGSGILVFALGSAVMGLCAVTIDWIQFTIRNQEGSLLGLSYSGSILNTAALIGLWGIGAGIGAFIGLSGNILQSNRLACVTVGIAWPLILPRVLQSIESSPRVRQAPVQNANKP
jgi:hypothetical protein